MKAEDAIRSMQEAAETAMCRLLSNAVPGSGTYTGTAGKPLTLDAINEAKRMLDNTMLADGPGEQWRVIHSPLMVEQIMTRQPRKKNNRRWVKKYRKKYSTTVPSQKVMISDTLRMVIVNPFFGSALDPDRTIKIMRSEA